MSDFSFLTNHALALVCVARDPSVRLRDIAECVGITERAAHRIVCELESEGYLTRRREGRRNVYELHSRLPLRHPLARHVSVDELLGLLLRPARGEAA